MIVARFTPRLSILPPAQRGLWQALEPAARHGMALYGGTAVALRLGHRASVDFDFFTPDALNREALWADLPFLASATVLQDRGETLTVLVPASTPESAQAFVKVSFFRTITFGRVGSPEMTDDGLLQVASLDDLMATKLKVIQQRAEAKDYVDIATMLQGGVDLPRGLAGARSLFGAAFQPSESLRALCYFEDGDLASLRPAVKQRLVAAASAVRALPDAPIVAQRLTIDAPSAGG